MYEFILFLRDRIAQIASMLHRFSFSIAGLDVTLLEIFLGFMSIGFVISVFWKGARS